MKSSIRQSIKEKISQHKIIFTIIGLLILGLLLWFGFQLYLYIKFLIGTDLALKLEYDNNDFHLLGGQSANVTFTTSRDANPLCTTTCSSYFIDLGRNKVIVNTFSLGTTSPIKETFTILQTRSGSGQELYRYTVKCNNNVSVYCNTMGETVERNAIITVEYSENESVKQNFEIYKNKLENQIASRNQAINDLATINAHYQISSQIVTIGDIQKEIVNANQTLNNLSGGINYSLSLWDEKRFNQLSLVIDKNQKLLNDVQNDITNFKLQINSMNGRYNTLASNIESKIVKFNELSSKKYNESTYNAILIMQEDLNRNIAFFSNKSTIAQKENSTANILNLDETQFLTSKENETAFFFTSKIVSNISRLGTISLIPLNYSESVSNPKPECCLNGYCNSCGNIPGTYPIIFLHGHDFNQDISAEYSLNIFDKLQNKLEEDGYIKAGEVSLSSTKRNESGLLGYYGKPVSFRGSYYFDFFSFSNGTHLVQTNGDNIDTYAIRLKGLIDDAMYETNQTKVILITHSMGGLVARRYNQIFGDDHIEKIILIGVPNHGVEGKIKSWCDVFGAQAECTDLDADSLFINKVNLPPYHKEITNIIGIGCPMTEGNGDGIVLNSSAYLPYADNYYIKGSCSDINLLHGEILDINKYPQVYTIINKTLGSVKD